MEEDARLAASLHRQLTLKNGEALDDAGVTVLADDLRAGTCDQFGDHTALGILVWQLQNGGPLPRNGVLPDLAILTGVRSGGAFGSECDGSSWSKRAAPSA